MFLTFCWKITSPSFCQVVTVLSIDGGGIRGLIPALVLEHLESRLGKPLSACFDVMVGTSAGGIIVLFLNVPDEHKKPRYTAKEIVQIYKNFGQTIFGQSYWQKFKTLNGWIGPKYPAQNLERFLDDYLGGTRLAEAITEIVIPTFDIGEDDTEFFTTNQARTKEGRNFYMKDLARATSAAPTYFSPYQLHESCGGQKKIRTLVDGGISVNNPIISSYIYATNHYTADNEMLFVSIGTGDVRPLENCNVIPYDRVKESGKIGWAKYILNLVMDGAKNLSDGQMQLMFPNRLQLKKEHLLGTPYVRLQVPIKPEHANLDDASSENIAQLELYARRLIKNSKEELDYIVRVLEEKSQRQTFVPRKLRETTPSTVNGGVMIK